MSIELTTERLLMREPRLSDAEPLMTVFGDADAMRYIGDGSVRTLDMVHESIKKRLACLAQHGVTLWTVIDSATGTLIGDCGVIPIDWKEAEFELAYRFAPTAWGKGYATEAGRAVMTHAWRATGLETIYGVTDLGNHASQRVLTKIGFDDIGTTDRYYGQMLRFFSFDRPDDSHTDPPNNPA